MEISWAWATYLILGGVLHIVFARIIDRGFSKEKMMMLGYALNAVFTFAYLFVATPFHLLLVQAGLGVAAALATPTWDALYAKYEDKKHDTYDWGLSEGTALIVTGVAIVVGGAIVSTYSFQVLFITMGCIQLLATLYQSRILYHASR